MRQIEFLPMQPAKPVMPAGEERTCVVRYLHPRDCIDYPPEPVVYWVDELGDEYPSGCPLEECGISEVGRRPYTLLTGWAR